MNLSDMIKNAEVAITCSNCGEKVKQKVGGLQSNPKLTCPGCGKVIRFEGGESLGKATQQADDALADFKRSIDEISDE